MAPPREMYRLPSKKPSDAGDLFLDVQRLLMRISHHQDTQLVPGQRLQEISGTRQKFDADCFAAGADL